MNTLLIDKKKYVLIKQSEYNKLLLKAALKNPVARKLSLKEGKKMAYSLVDEWHKGK